MTISPAPDSAAPEPMFLQTGTVHPVSDIYGTEEWYQRALGFETVYIHGSGRRGENEDFANYLIMKRDGVEVSFILDEGDPDDTLRWTRAGTGYLTFRVRDVDAVYTDLVSRGVPIARKLEKENWPARGFRLRDPSGNEICITQPI